MRIINPQNVPTGHDAADLLALPQDERMAWLRANVGDFETVAERTTDGTDDPINGSNTAPVEISATVTAISEKPAQKINTTKPARLRVIQGNTVAEMDPDADPDAFPMSEDHIAQVFADRYHPDWRYIKKWNTWMHYGEEGWLEDEKEAIDRLVMLHCRTATTWSEATILTASERRKIGQKRTGGAIRDIARNDPRIAASTEQWDADPFLIGIKGGGAFDVRTGGMVDVPREAYQTKRTAVIPEPGSPEMWIAHLDRMMSGNTDMIHYLQLWAGYCLTGSTREQCLTLLYGQGQTGKGTYLLTLQDVAGTYAISAAASTFMDSKAQAHLTELARLNNRRMVIIDEIPSDAKWNEERIKRATGGGLITCNFMHSNLFDQLVTWKLSLASNHKPSMRSVGKDMQRRIRLVKCNAGIPDDKVDRNYRAKMVETEGGKILNWALEGAAEWYKNGLPLPDAISDATKDYVDGMDVIGDWLRECTTEGGTTARPAAYASFRKFMEASGAHPWGVQSWWGAMEDRGYTIKRTAAARIVQNLTLREQFDTTTERWEAD